jgi:hypothetical protein
MILITVSFVDSSCSCGFLWDGKGVSELWKSTGRVEEESGYR